MNLDPVRVLARIARAEAWRLLRINARYPIETVASMVTLYGVFFLMHAMAGRLPGALLSFGGEIHQEVLLYAAWMCAYTLIGTAHAQLAADLATGALEPVLSTGMPGARLMAGRALGSAAQSGALCLLLVLGVFAWAPAGAPVPSAAGIVAAVAVLLGTSVGLSLLLCGAVLVFRRVSFLMLPLSVLIMFAMMAPMDPGVTERLAAVPYVAARGLLVQAAAGRLDAGLLAWGLACAFACLGLGRVAYGAFERRARRRGLLCTG